MNVTICSCGLGSSELRDGRTRNMLEKARSKKSAEQNERAADRPVDRRVGAKPKTTANTPKSRERTSKRDAEARGIHQNNECAHCLSEERFRNQQNYFAPLRHPPAQPFHICALAFLARPTARLGWLETASPSDAQYSAAHGIDSDVLGPASEQELGPKLNRTDTAYNCCK